MIQPPVPQLPPHILKLERVGVFRSHRGIIPRGRLIKHGLEEIELLIGGKASFDLDGQCYQVAAGSMLWHRAGEETVHRSDVNDPYRCLVISFSVNDTPPTRPPRLSAWRNAAAAVAFAEELESSFHRGDIDHDLLCNYAYTTCTWQAHAAGPSRANPILPSALQRALNIIADDFADDLDLPTVAQRAQISLPHLHSLCRQYLQSTPSKLLEERRFRHARWLLSDGALAIAEIAKVCGFSEAGTFCRAFKRRQGMTPGEYRQRYSTPD